MVVSCASVMPPRLNASAPVSLLEATLMVSTPPALTVTAFDLRSAPFLSVVNVRLSFVPAMAPLISMVRSTEAVESEFSCTVAPLARLGNPPEIQRSEK